MNLIAIFDSETQNLAAKLATDEWFFSKFRERIVKPLTPSEAFDLIPQAVDLVMREDDLRIECFELLMDLARHSGTTEMPQALATQWTKLISHIKAYGDYGELRANELSQWYRKSVQQ